MSTTELRLQCKACPWKKSTVPERDIPGFPPRPFDRDGWGHWLAAGLPEPVVRGAADGVPDRLDRLAALGNAVVEAVAEPIGIAIREAT